MVASARANNYLLDGTENNDISVGGNAQQFQFLDAVQEVSVQTSNFGAEFGRGGGGVFNCTRTMRMQLKFIF